MFALPAILTLISFIYLRPHEVLPSFHGAPWIPLLFAACILGMVLDLRLRLVRPWPAAGAGLALAFYLWAVASTLVSKTTPGNSLISSLAVSVLLCLLLAHGLQSFRAIEATAITVVGVAIALSGMGVVQAQSALECIRVEPGIAANETIGRPEGRPCASAYDCDLGGEPGFEYVCEKAGVAGTTSTGGSRVRYRGVLQDPNELALAVGLALPLAMSLWSRRKSVFRLLLLLPALGLGLACIVATASRTGQLAVGVVAVAFFATRHGWKGFLPAILLAAPALFLGGRSGGEAFASSQERLEAWAAGLRLWRSSPLWGIGQGQFIEYHYITAHNSLVLAAAELGTVGLFLWIALFYTGFKLTIFGIRKYRDRPEADVAYRWGRGLFALLCGMAAGTSFLSLTYHPLAWLTFGLVGAYGLAIRRHDPEGVPRFGWRDSVAVVGISAFCITGLHVYTRLRGY